MGRITFSFNLDSPSVGPCVLLSDVDYRLRTAYSGVTFGSSNPRKLGPEMPDQDWTEPAANGDPERRVFRTRTRAVRSSFFHGHRPATGSRSSPRSRRAARRRSARTARPSRRPSPRSPEALAPLRVALLAVGCSSTSVPACTSSTMGIFDTDFDKYTEDAVQLVQRDRHHHRRSPNSKASRRIGRRTPRRSSTSSAIISCPSFLEYGEYPYVTADEIKKALRLKAAVLRPCSIRCSNPRRCSSSTTSSTSC